VVRAFQSGANATKGIATRRTTIASQQQVVACHFFKALVVWDVRGKRFDTEVAYLHKPYVAFTRLVNKLLLGWLRAPFVVEEVKRLCPKPTLRKDAVHFSTPSSFSTRATISRRSSTTASSSVMASAARSCGSGRSPFSSSDSSLSQ